MGLFDEFLGTKPKPKRRKPKRKVIKRKTKKKHAKKILKNNVSKKRTSNVSMKINRDFNKIKKILSSFSPKKILSTNALKKKSEKEIENILFGALGMKLGGGVRSQIRKKNGIVDLVYGRIGIEIKLCKEGGVRRIRDRLHRQVREYNKKFKKLVIYILNFEKSSRQNNLYVKRFLEKDFSDIKSLKKRDLSLIIRKV